MNTSAASAVLVSHSFEAATPGSRKVDLERRADAYHVVAGAAADALRAVHFLLERTRGIPSGQPAEEEMGSALDSLRSAMDQLAGARAPDGMQTTGERGEYKPQEPGEAEGVRMRLLARCTEYAQQLESVLKNMDARRLAEVSSPKNHGLRVFDPNKATQPLHPQGRAGAVPAARIAASPR